jgi:hypothetical protein
MKYGRCGRSGLMLPRISLGLWHNFGDVDRHATGRDVILRAFDWSFPRKNSPKSKRYCVEESL